MTAAGIVLLTLAGISTIAIGAVVVAAWAYDRQVDRERAAAAAASPTHVRIVLVPANAQPTDFELWLQEMAE